MLGCNMILFSGCNIFLSKNAYFSIFKMCQIKRELNRNRDQRRMVQIKLPLLLREKMELSECMDCLSGPKQIGCCREVVTVEVAVSRGSTVFKRRF